MGCTVYLVPDYNIAYRSHGNKKIMQTLFSCVKVFPEPMEIKIVVIIPSFGHIVHCILTKMQNVNDAKGVILKFRLETSELYFPLLFAGPRGMCLPGSVG